jgi:hypothetical protein
MGKETNKEGKGKERKIIRRPQVLCLGNEPSSSSHIKKLVKGEVIVQALVDNVKNSDGRWKTSNKEKEGWALR